MKKKNGMISVIKFCLIIIIIMHYSIPFSIGNYMFAGGYIYVDFFFILQGFYLIRDQDSDISAFDSAKKYFVDRLKRFFPCVFFASILMLVMQVLVNINNNRIVAKSILAFGAQISFVLQLFDFMTLDVGGIF